MEKQSIRISHGPVDDVAPISGESSPRGIAIDVAPKTFPSAPASWLQIAALQGNAQSEYPRSEQLRVEILKMFTSPFFVLDRISHFSYHGIATKDQPFYPRLQPKTLAANFKAWKQVELLSVPRFDGCLIPIFCQI